MKDYTFPGTQWLGGLNGINDLTNLAKVRVVGLVLKDPSTNSPVILAERVRAL